MSSFDLHYEQGRIIDFCAVDAEDTLRRAISRLPDEVREFAYDRCRFASVGASMIGQTLPPGTRWLILVRDEETDESVIAHEIAHAWRGHEGPNTDSQEQEVRALVRSWGFSGLGTDDVA